jgi:hypothetical protein
VGAREVDPFAAIGTMLANPDVLDAERGKPFASDAAPGRNVAERNAAAAAATPKPAPAAAEKKLTKAAYEAKLEATLRANPEYATLVNDVANKVLFDVTYGPASSYEPDPDEDSALDDLLGDY